MRLDEIEWQLPKDSISSWVGRKDLCHCKCIVWRKDGTYSINETTIHREPLDSCTAQAVLYHIYANWTAEHTKECIGLGRTTRPPREVTK